MLIGVDLGGTKISAVAMTRTGEEAERRRIPTPKGDYPGTLSAIAELVAGLERDHGPAEALGVGTPGSISPRTGRLRNSAATWLNTQHLRDDLQRVLGRSIALDNDANCLALSEAKDGAAKGFQTAFCVILGTGVGAGFVVDGTVLSGANGLTGEWGHVPLPGLGEDADDLACYCGQRDCIETHLSGTGLGAAGRRAGLDTPEGRHVLDLVAAGDATATAIWDRYRAKLGQGLAMIINILDPHVIVLAGGVSRAPGLLDDLTDQIAPHIFADQWQTPVMLSVGGDDTGVRGAAWLALDQMTP